MALLMTTLSLPAYAGHKGGLEKCLRAATALRSGDYIKVEYLGFADEGGSAYEIEVKDVNGKYWEFECSADNNQITEIEQEVKSADDPLFKRNLKIKESEARKIALDLYPGKIKEVEYEIESDGKASYEFDITDHFGVEFKIEVDASTGEIVEVQIEQWQIGGEDEVK